MMLMHHISIQKRSTSVERNRGALRLLFVDWYGYELALQLRKLIGDVILVAELKLM